MLLVVINRNPLLMQQLKRLSEFQQKIHTQSKWPRDNAPMFEKRDTASINQAEKKYYDGASTIFYPTASA